LALENNPAAATFGEGRMTNIRSRLIAVSVAALATGLFSSGINAEVVVRGIEGKPTRD
jgi:hypothetical protein